MSFISVMNYDLSAIMAVLGECGTNFEIMYYKVIKLDYDKE